MQRKMMMRSCVFIFLGLLLGPGAQAGRVKVTPVQKVIQMLQGMVEKSKKEKHEEEAQYAQYNQFCADTSETKARSIEEATQMIEKLNADIEKYGSDAEALAAEIATHEEDIAVWTGDNEAATKVRDIEHADYVAEHKDYEESLDALGRAIDFLKAKSKDIPQAASEGGTDAELLQQVYKSMPDKAKQQIDAFLATDPSVGAEASDAKKVRDARGAAGLLEVSQPEVAAYEFQSQGIIDMLEKLKDKFQNEMDKMMQEESAAAQAYELLLQDLRDQVNQATEAVGMKRRIKADKLEAKATAEGDLAETQATMADDKKSKADLEATCTQKASDFESRQQLRAEEIEAIERAIEILSSGAVSGAAEKHLPGAAASLLSKSRSASASSFVQLRSLVRSPNQLRASAFLKEQGAKLNSAVLSTLAVAAGEDPFAKVKQLIQQLITKLMAEASEEAEHKGWCDEELATNEMTRKKKTEQVEVLTSEIDELNASIAQLTTEISDLTEQLTDLAKAVAEATKNRQEEKAKNTETVSEAQEAQAAVAQALSVLQEFYAKAAEATALVQKQKKQAPEIFDEPFKGNQAGAEGPIGLLEVIQSDFARLESETSANEKQAQKEYDEFMNDAAVSKAQKQKDVEHKTMKRQNQQQELQEKKGDLEMTQDELNKALDYYQKLKPSCIDVGMSYEEKRARRKEEIESLQEALKILSGEQFTG